MSPHFGRGPALCVRPQFRLRRSLPGMPGIHVIPFSGGTEFQHVGKLPCQPMADGMPHLRTHSPFLPAHGEWSGTRSSLRSLMMPPLLFVPIQQPPLCQGFDPDCKARRPGKPCYSPSPDSADGSCDQVARRNESHFSPSSRFEFDYYCEMVTLEVPT